MQNTAKQNVLAWFSRL